MSDIAESKTWIQTGSVCENSEGQLLRECICPKCRGLSYFRSSSNELVGANYCPNCGTGLDKNK